MPELLHSPQHPPARLLVDNYLEQQGNLTAVEKFAQRYAQGAEPLQAKYYRDLIPLERPQPGQQYAFEVNLDQCTGCKACVAACHELNGLDDDETWRFVGQLLGGNSELPVLQHVTSSCHHCLEPACLYGCPVNAYEKDPVTGIVRHLDDQCIGCQYCILKCPYDAPTYNKKLGIVRKCDMCSDRLAVGEAPACVQACPTSAIRITVVDRQAVVEDSEANVFLPESPDSHYTLPTTTYKTTRALPRNLLPADYYALKPAAAHLSLVWMLVLTQMSVGAFVADLALDALAGGERMGLWLMRALGALLVGILGMGAAVGHLGRPIYAFRAMIGLRRSWLSREILAFGLFALCAAAYAEDVWFQHLSVAVPAASSIARYLAAAFGLGGVFCSVMIYVDTHKPFWNLPYTSVKFFMTAVVLGIPTLVLICLLGAAITDQLSAHDVMSQFGNRALSVLLGATILKLAFEAAVLVHLADRKHTPLKRTALLLTGELRPYSLRRVLLGLAGGVVLPGVLLAEQGLAGSNPIALGAGIGLVLALLLAGELMERYLFFAAVVAPKMPGAAAS
jgi:Fe-S-cluster-containing dehydrogenase component/DMSO reductase anchor subunit